MNPQDYSESQRKDIEERVEKAKSYLKELQLQPAAIMQMANVGKDIFGVQPLVYLQDLKYQNVVSPIQNP